MCKHQWQLAIPNEVEPDKKMDLVALLIVRPQMGRTYYCPLCNATGHSVYGRRIKKHTSDFFLQEVNKERANLNLPTLKKEIVKI